MRKTRTFYMHTLDGKPASVQRNGRDVWLVYAGGRHRAPLVPTLDRIRREQQSCIATERRAWPATGPTLDRYGYVLVEVPHVG